MYLCFTNDLPEIVHDHDSSYKQPNMYCTQCGSTVCYVDDSTYTYAHSDPETLSNKISSKYSQFSEYMSSNRLVINPEKTHLVVMGSKKMDQKRQQVTLQAGEHTIKPSESEKLLGAQIHQSLKWKCHIQDSDQSLLRMMTSRVNALRKISANATFQTKLRVANGIVLSKLAYLIPLWGGCEDYLIKALQVIQNKAARAVTGLNCFTSTKELLKTCNWLSVRQMVFYFTVLTTHKTIMNGAPKYLKDRLCSNFPYRTRQKTQGELRFGQTFAGKHSLTHDSFCYRSVNDYNSIPAAIRLEQKLPSFKFRLKKWIKDTIPIN